MNFAVSVIIPVYGVEKYIKRCLVSLFEQTISHSIEYIFVDDYSPDNSVKIIEDTADEYGINGDSLRIIRHKVNKGVSISRQDGLKAATGEYVIHCDPDDWVERDAYESLYKEAIDGNYDIVICDYKEIGDGEILFEQKPDVLTSEYILSQLPSGNLIGSTWNKLIRREVARATGFTPGISYCEDFLYTCQLLVNPLRISYIGRPLYFYWQQRDESLTRILNAKSFESDLELFDSLVDLGNRFPKYKPYFNEFIGRTLLRRLFRYDIDNSKFRDLRKFKGCIGSVKTKNFLHPLIVRASFSIGYNSAKRFYQMINKIRGK